MTTTDTTPLTVNSPVFALIKNKIELTNTGYAFQAYVDRINQSIDLISALNNYQAAGMRIEIDADPNTTNVKYLPDSRDLTLNLTTLISPTWLTRALAHEIYGHDGTRSVIQSVLDPQNVLYQGKTADEVRGLVTTGCFMVEALGFIGEYRIGLQAGFSPTGYVGLEADISNAINAVRPHLPPNSDTRTIDLAAAQFMATRVQANDVGHAQQCANWASYVVSATPSPTPSAQMRTEFNPTRGEGSTTVSAHAYSLDARLTTEGALVVDDESYVDGVATSVTTTNINVSGSAVVSETDTNHDGAVDSIQLRTPQSGTTINQSPTSVPNLASPSTDYLSSTVNSLRDGFRYEDPYLVDATEMRIFVGVQDMSGSWGGARLLEFGTSPLADWYNLDQSDMIGNDVDPSLNGYLGDFGAINFRDYDGNGLVPNWNEGDSTSYMSFGWGLNASPAFSPSDFDDFYGYGGVWDSSFGLDNSWNNDSISLFTIDDGLLFTPVVLDLDGDGIELVKRQDSRAYYDVAGDGFRRNVSWVSPQDGLLAIDKDSNGQIKDADELSFARWTATPNDSDLQGLRTYFDTNSNGLLDSGDGKYSLMRIWRDMNGDGVSDAGELQTLAQAGISTINLYAAPVNFDLQGGAISGFTNFTRSNGQVGWAADVALEYEAEGLKVTGSGSGFVEITSASGLKMMMGTGVLLSVTPSASAGYGGAVLTAGDDFFAFQPASSSVFASAPSLLLEGLGGNDTLYGSWQDDWIDGGTGNDWLMGLDGDDVVVADSPGDTVTGGSGFDILQVATGTGLSFTNTADKSFEGFLGGAGNDAFFGNVVTRYVLAGAGGNDTLVGNTLDDVLTGGDGADRLDGGAGTDTAVYNGLRSSYAISKGVGSYTVSGADGSDTLLNIERIHFWDVDTAFDANGAAGKAFRAYEAALGRAPDVGGLGWFMNQLEHGISLAQLSGGLIASAEFTGHYGSSLTNSQFLTLLYANALHRAPDAGGLAWWLTEMSSNPSATRASAVTSFSESTECQAFFVGVITAGVDYIPVV